MLICTVLLLVTAILSPFSSRAARESSHGNIDKAIAKAVIKAKLDPNLSVEEIASRLDPYIDPLEDGIFANRRITEALRHHLHDVVCEESAAGYLRRRERNRIRMRRQLQREGKLGRAARAPRREVLDPYQEKKSQVTKAKTQVALQAEMNAVYAKMHQIHLTFKEQPRRFITNLEFLKGDLTSNQYGRVMNGLMDLFKVKDDWRKIYGLEYKKRQRRLRRGKGTKIFLNSNSSDEDIADDASIRNVRYRLKKSIASASEGQDGQGSRYTTRLSNRKGKEEMKDPSEHEVNYDEDISLDEVKDRQGDATSEEYLEWQPEMAADQSVDDNRTISNTRGGPSRPLHDFVLPYNWYSADDTRSSLQDLTLGASLKEGDNEQAWQKDQDDPVEKVAELPGELPFDDVLIDVQPHFSVEELMGGMMPPSASRNERGDRSRPTTASITIRNRPNIF